MDHDQYCNCEDCWWSDDQMLRCPTCWCIIGLGCPCENEIDEVKGAVLE